MGISLQPLTTQLDDMKMANQKDLKIGVVIHRQGQRFVLEEETPYGFMCSVFKDEQPNGIAIIKKHNAYLFLIDK